MLVKDDTNKATLGGLDLQAGAQGAGDGQTGGDPSASKEVIRTRRQRSDAGQARGASPQQSRSSVPALSKEQFDALYSPELWGRIASTPGDAALAVTGHKVWKIEDNERLAMGHTSALAAQCFAIENPKYLALAAAIITVGNIYGVRLAIYLAELKKEREEKNKKA